MSESVKNDGWEELEGDDDENGDEILIPEGREMTMEEQRRFLAWIFADFIGQNEQLIARIGETG